MSRVASRDPRVWVLLPVAVLVVSGTAAGCSTSSKPAYCKDAGQLKSAVKRLGEVDVAKNGIGSLTTALDTVKTDAATMSTDAKTAFGPQTEALKQALSGLDTAVQSAKGQSDLTAAKAIVPAVSQVKTAASDLQDAVSGKCK